MSRHMVAGMFILGVVWQVDPMLSIIPLCVVAGLLYTNKEGIEYHKDEVIPNKEELHYWPPRKFQPDFTYGALPDK